MIVPHRRARPINDRRRRGLLSCEGSRERQRDGHRPSFSAASSRRGYAPIRCVRFRPCPGHTSSPATSKISKMHSAGKQQPALLWPVTSFAVPWASDAAPFRATLSKTLSKCDGQFPEMHLKCLILLVARAVFILTGVCGPREHVADQR